MSNLVEISKRCLNFGVNSGYAAITNSQFIGVADGLAIKMENAEKSGNPWVYLANVF